MPCEALNLIVYEIDSSFLKYFSNGYCGSVLEFRVYAVSSFQ